MSYIILKDFRGGEDHRRKPIAGTPGTLTRLRNAVINEGGDIERRMAIVPVYKLPAGKTFGLSGNGTALCVFGTEDEPANMPRRVVYQKLTGTSLYSGGLSRILDVDYFNGNPYVVALFGDGDVQHFYLGDIVTDWREAGLQPSVTTKAGVASFLARYINTWSDFRAIVSGDTFAISGAGGQAFTVVLNHADLSQAATQAATAGSAEVRATATVTITSGDAGGTIDSMFAFTKPLIEAPVKWSLRDDQTAVNLADAINSYRETHGVLAQAISNTVKLTAPVGLGAGANIFSSITYATGIGITDGNFAGGVNAVEALSQVTTVTVGGTFSSGSNYWLTINGQPFRVRASVDGALARTALTHRNFVYSAARTLLYRSGLNQPTQWPKTGHSYVGATTIATGNAAGAAAFITGLGLYGDDIAVFSARGVQVWQMDPDPDLNVRLRYLANTGTRAAKSIVSYGNDDLFYLADNGIRSLRQVDSSGLASIGDVGSPIDPAVRAAVNGATDLQIERAQSVIDPVSGRVMLSIGKQIFVLSRYPDSKVRAWSVWNVDFEIEEMTTAGRRVYFRSGDTIYCYGGLGLNQWPASGEAAASVWTPFYDAGTPATKKQIKGIDGAFENEWSVRLMLDPDNSAASVNIGRLKGATFAREDIEAHSEATHFGLRMTCSEAGPASIANIVVHYDGPPPPTVR